MQVINPIEFYAVWKPITRMCGDIKEGIYWISTFGRIYSIAKANRYGRENGFLKPELSIWGYYRAFLCNNDGVAKPHGVHRLVMIEFCPVPNFKNLQVNHLNGIKTCNYIYNLQWCTCSENAIHAFKMGLRNGLQGEQNPAAKISDNQAEEIAKMLSSGNYTQKDISQITGVSCGIITNIANGNDRHYLYEKYNLADIMKQKYPYKFSDDDLHKLCKYFEENKYKFNSRKELFQTALNDLFGMNYDIKRGKTINRIYRHEVRKEITDKYNY